MSAPPALKCLDGGSAPPGVAGDLRAIERLPARVKDDLWDAIAPNLTAQIDERAAAAVTAFCQSHRVTHGDLAAPIAACRFLFRQAAKSDLDVDALRADAAALSGEGSPLVERLAAWYERARPLLRQEIIVTALAQHGNLVTGVDWRLDVVQQSQDGVALEAPVVLMTFRYRKGEDKKRVTLQFLPAHVKELQAICNKMMT